MRGTAHRLFPYDLWTPRLPELARQYQEARPFPNIQLPDFLELDVAAALVREFPRPADTSWIHYKHYNEHKLGKSRRADFPPAIGRIVDEFNTPEFAAFMSRLTGIPDLLADPGLEGGGMHQTEPGGFLNVHADFTMHHHQTRWHRRVNLILYLNEHWTEDWRGELELWDRSMSSCVTKIPPRFNHAAVFNTDEHSFHGYPDPIQFPSGVNRKSLALYYYTLETDPHYAAKSTDYRPRPTDSRTSSFLIWADKKAVHAYSVMKRTLGLSDDFAGKWLGKFSRKP